MKRLYAISLSALFGFLLSACGGSGGGKANQDMAGMSMKNTHHDTVNLSTALKPANEFVLASVPTTIIQEKEIKPMVEAIGTVDYDMRGVGAISAKVSGRIDRLNIKYRYQPVQKGDRVMDVYSPELVTAQENLLFLLKNDPENTTLIADARERLQLLGMTGGQIQHLITDHRVIIAVPVFSNYTGHIHEAQNENMVPSGSMNQAPSGATEPLSIKEGAYIEKGQQIFTIYNPGRSWILLNIYPDDQNKVTVGNEVDITAETAPQKVWHGLINYIEPFLRSGNKTLTARVYFDNTQAKLPIGSQVRAAIRVQGKKSLTLPEDAVVSLGLHKIVFKKTNGEFRAIVVETGSNYNGRIAILKGLAKTDSVAANAQFLMDSESFIKTKE